MPASLPPPGCPSAGPSQPGGTFSLRARDLNMHVESDLLHMHGWAHITPLTFSRRGCAYCSMPMTWRTTGTLGEVEGSK